jgi:hypothetical protein
LGPRSGGGPVGLSDGGTDGTGSSGAGGKRVASDATMNADVGLMIAFFIIERNERESWKRR